MSHAGLVPLMELAAQVGLSALLDEHVRFTSETILRRGLSPLAVTISIDTAAPVIAGVRLRAGRAGSAKGATSMVIEAINTAIQAGAQPQHILLRGTRPATVRRPSPR